MLLGKCLLLPQSVCPHKTKEKYTLYKRVKELTEELQACKNKNIFNWNKPLPSNQYFKTEVLKLSKFYVLTFVETTLEKNKDEKYNDSLTSLTHELKTPLSVIIGYLETINLKNLPNQENQISA